MGDGFVAWNSNPTLNLLDFVCGKQCDRLLTLLKESLVIFVKPLFARQVKQRQQETPPNGGVLGITVGNNQAIIPF